MEQQLRLYASDLAYLAPELTLLIAAVILSVMDLFLPKKTDRRMLGWLALLSILVAMCFVIYRIHAGEIISLLNDSYRIDGFANLFKLVFLTGAGFIILMGLGSVQKKDIPHTGEFYYLFLPAILGAMIMASSGDLITLFVGLELLSITSYILVGMRKHSQRANEGAFKYLVLGGISSAFILYGMSFLYGMTGSTNIGEINYVLSENLGQFETLIYVSFFLMLVGFAFKIAAAPFHTWAPEVYESAASPVTAFLAIVSKAAAFAIFIRIVYNVYYNLGVNHPFNMPVHDDVFLTIAVLAAIAMVIGNVVALRQDNMKRLLAYSGVANAGYLLVPLAVPFTMVHASNFTEFTFYLMAYLFMTIGAIAVLIVLSQHSGNEKISSFAGLYYRAPFTAFAMVLFILSLAGLPPTGGFFGKIFILLGAVQAHQYWLAAIMIATSIISFYYYFTIIRQMFMRSNESSEVKLTGPLAVTIWLCAIATLLLGLVPHIVIEYIESVFSITFDLFFS